MSQTERKGKYNRPLSEDEMQQVFKVGAMLSIGAVVFMGLTTILVHTETIRLYPSSMSVEIVRGYAGRVEYALRYQTLLVSWLLFNVLATIYGRLSTKSINPLDSTTEDQVTAHKMILTNSFEQIVISVFAQLIFVSFASPEAILKFIPAVNIIQFVGRIAFFAGYPLKRAFGFQCSIVPNIVLVLYSLYKFFSFLGMY